MTEECKEDRAFTIICCHEMLSVITLDLLTEICCSLLNKDRYVRMVGTSYFYSSIDYP
jgi:hypothetical protein